MRHTPLVIVEANILCVCTPVYIQYVTLFMCDVDEKTRFNKRSLAKGNARNVVNRRKKATHYRYGIRQQNGLVL